jgi:uncharacterized protein YbjT (DUF2867 family)
MRVLVIGGYGLIGLEIVRALQRAGHDIVGLGRSAQRGRRLAPGIAWIGANLKQMQAPDDWTKSLSGIDAVVNASGALQDGARDDLAAVQDKAIRALIAACEACSVRHFIQISAPGAEPNSKLAFLSTKAAADAALRASKLNWAIFKPGLVIAANAYGGTQMLRMLAAMPFVQPLLWAKARIQTVAASDVGDGVSAVLAGRVASRRVYDLVEDEEHTLSDIVKTMRRWVGRDDAMWVWRLPAWLGAVLARFADLAGWMGWRSPMRTTALKSLAANITGDPKPWREAGGFPLKSLDQTLATIPATMQERVFGRVQLVYPALVLILAAFWLASGLISLANRSAAEAVLAGKFDSATASVAVGAGITLDLLIGWALLWRAWTRRAAWGSILVSLGYLAAGTWVTPELWADPLGPFVKVFPAIALALAVAALTEER